MPRILKWLIITPLLLILTAAIVIPLLLDEDKLIELASVTLKEQTGAILVVDGGASLSIFPRIAISLGDARLTMPEDETSSVSVHSLGVGVELMPLLSRQVEIGEITVDGLVAVLQAPPETPQLDTSNLSDEELDAFYEARRREISEAGETAGAETALAVPLALNVQRLSVSDSRIEQVDAASGERTVVELLSLDAKGLNLDGKPIPLEVQLRLQGSGDSPPLELSLDGEVRVDQTSQLLTLNTMLLELRGATAQPVKLEMQGEVELANQVANLKLKIGLGETRGDGTLRYASFESPQIDADLHLNLFDPALLVLAGPEAAQKQPGEEAGDGNSGDEPLPLDALRSIDTRARLTIDRAVFDGHAITDMQAKLRAVEGVVILRSLTGNLHGGKLDLKGRLNGKHSTAKMHTEGGLAAMDIATALTAAGSEPILTGKADVKWKLDSSGKTSNQLIEALKGAINIEARDAVLEGMGIDRMMCQAVALANQEALGTTLPDNSRFETLSVRLKLEDGKARLTPLKAELAHLKLNGEGRLHLVEQDFSATFAASLSPELAELDPACRVSERLTSIDWPVVCKGSINGDPADWCGVDTEEILSDLVTNEAERKVKKEAGKLLDKLFKR